MIQSSFDAWYMLYWHIDVLIQFAYSEYICNLDMLFLFLEKMGTSETSFLKGHLSSAFVGGRARMMCAFFYCLKLLYTYQALRMYWVFWANANFQTKTC